MDDDVIARRTHDVVTGLYAVLYNLDEEERKAKVEEMVNEAVEKIEEQKAEKVNQATKEWLNELYAKTFGDGTRLEDSDAFIEWMNEVNNYGHQRYKYTCYRCDGTGKIAGVIKGSQFDCRWCEGGVAVGPPYCTRNGFHITFLHKYFTCQKSY